MASLPSAPNPAIDHPILEPATEEALPPTTQRRDSLEKALQQRPDPQQLKDRNILLDTKAAPALQSTQHDLERQRATDNLKKGLSQRPERDELIERNILPSSTAAPSLQSQQRDLERHMRKDSLEKNLSRRPTADDLVKDGILRPDEAALESPVKEE